MAIISKSRYRISTTLSVTVWYTHINIVIFLDCIGCLLSKKYMDLLGINDNKIVIKWYILLKDTDLKMYINFKLDTLNFRENYTTYSRWQFKCHKKPIHLTHKRKKSATSRFALNFTAYSPKYTDFRLEITGRRRNFDHSSRWRPKSRAIVSVWRASSGRFTSLVASHLTWPLLDDFISS